MKRIDPDGEPVKADVCPLVDAVSLARITGAVVAGYRLSGWRHDKHGHYRTWRGLPAPILASSVGAGDRVYANMPLIQGDRAASQMSARMVPKSSLAKKKANVDTWLATKIQAVKERDHG